jgi:chromosome segregation ATPase
MNPRTYIWTPAFAETILKEKIQELQSKIALHDTEINYLTLAKKDFEQELKAKQKELADLRPKDKIEQVKDHLTAVQNLLKEIGV